MGIMLFSIGVFVAPAVFILPIILDGSERQEFMIPGSTEVDILEVGRYYLWNDYQTVYDGKSYNRSENLPDGLEITIRNEGGERLSFIGDASITSSSGSRSKSSIGYVDIEHPSKLTVSVTGVADPRVFSFSKSGIMKILGMLFGGFGLSLLLALAGIGISIWGIIKLVNNNQKGDSDCRSNG